MTRRISQRQYKEPITNVNDKELVKQPWDHHRRGNSLSSIGYFGSPHFQDDTDVAAVIYPMNNERGSGYHSHSSFDPYSEEMDKNSFPRAMFTPDTSIEYEKEINPEDTALQFVPALKRDQMVRRLQSSSIRPVAAASWDAILQDEEKKEPESLPPSQRCIDNQDAATSVSAVHTRKVGGRIARLASMFSSRATIQIEGNDSTSAVPTYQRSNESSVKHASVNNHVSQMTTSDPLSNYERNNISFVRNVALNNHTSKMTTPVPPVSPAQSSGSSAYVGWPGTQDRRGRTVTQQSSYEDSSVGGGSSLQRNQVNNARDKEIKEVALKEVSRWTKSAVATDAAFDDFSSAESSVNVSSRNINRRRRSLVSCRSSPVQEEEQSMICRDNHFASDESNACFDSDEVNAAEYHLAAAVADAKRSQANNRRSMSALRYAQSDVGQARNLPVSWKKNQFSVVSEGQSTATHSVRFEEAFPADRTDPSSRKTADTSCSETSVGGGSSPAASSGSADAVPARKIGLFYNKENTQNVTAPKSNKLFARYGSMQSAPDTTISQYDQKSRAWPPTENALAENNRRKPPHRTFPNAEGFMGLLDKTKDVPSLLDNLDSDSMSSSKATSVYSATNGSNQPDAMLIQSQRNIQQRSHQGLYDDSPPPGILRNGTARAATTDGDCDSDVFDDVSVSNQSDVFDDISLPSPRRPRTDKTRHYPARIAEEEDSVPSDSNEAPAADGNDFKLVVIAGGITTIQSPDFDYSNRRTASDYDDQLTASEVSSNGYTRIPGFEEMIAAGTDRDSSLHGIHGNIGQAPRPRHTHNVARSLVLEDLTCFSDGDGADSEAESCSTGDGDLTQYYVQPSVMKKVLNKYRELSEFIDSEMSLEEFEREEDEHKAFALFEMRSRIMEKDMERGLERRGGTAVVDDIVTTAFHRTSHRIRDAVMVCKAWRDGASFADVIKASLLGRRGEKTFYIKRRVRNGYGNNRSASFMCDTASFASGFSSSSSAAKFYWEPVKWLDDTDVLQYRCSSLGARHLRGFEMFTIGDCQSILLKLTNERCMELRLDLNEATSRQIEAEEMLKEESDNFHGGEMTEAEFEYLTSMEEVKVISKKLVQAEQSFTLVRDRIKKLISKYEAILMKIETGSSIVTYDSSYYSDYDSAYWSEIEKRDREMWAKRAKRAEIRAELAAREAFLAKQETREIHESKERELEALKQKLLEVQSEASSPAPMKENSALIAKSLAMRRNDVVGPVNDTSRAVMESKTRINNEKIQDVKQRFRERIAAKKNDSGVHANFRPSSSTDGPTPGGPSQALSKDVFRSAGEEMFQQMDFYERSLKAVDRVRY